MVRCLPSGRGRLGGVEALLKDGRADIQGRADSVGPEARQALEEGLKVGRWRTVPQMHGIRTPVHVLIQDGAGFHLTEGHEGLSDNVRIITLPPYSPELNPVEGLWDQLKDSLCNRVFPSLSGQRDIIVSWLQFWWADSRRVRSLIPDWLRLQANASSGNIIPVN